MVNDIQMQPYKIPNVISKFTDGYTQCVTEVSRYLGKSSNMESEVQTDSLIIYTTVWKPHPSLPRNLSLRHQLWGGPPYQTAVPSVSPRHALPMVLNATTVSNASTSSPMLDINQNHIFPAHDTKLSAISTDSLCYATLSVINIDS